MLKWLVTVLLNRLVFLIVLFCAVSAYTRSSCSVQDDPISEIGRAISSMRELAAALEKH